MNYYFFIPIATFLFHFFIFTYVFAMDRESRVNRAFLLFTAVMALWVLGCTIYYIPMPEEVILSSMRLLSLAWCFTGFTFTAFLYGYIDRKRGGFYYSILAAAIISVILTNTTDLVIASHKSYPWGQWIVEGPLYLPVVGVTFTIPILLGCGLLFYHRRKETNLARYKQHSLIIFGILANFVIGSLLEFLPAVLDNSGEMIRLTSSSTVILTGTFFYSIIRYRFLVPDIRDTAEAIFAGVQDGIIILGARGKVSHANESARRLLDLDQHLEANTHLESLIPGYDHTKEYHNHEIEFQNGEQTLVLLLTQSRIKFTEVRYGIILLIRNVTEQRRITRQLRDSEEQYRALVENISEIIFEVSSDSIVTYISPAVTAATGHRADEMTGKSFFEFIHPEESDKVRKLFSDSSVDPVQLEFRGLCADGTYRHFMSSGATAIKHEDRFTYRGVLTNIENLVQAREKLRETESLYNSIVHNITDVIWIMRIRDLTITYVSPSVSNLHGHEPGEYIDTPLQKHVTSQSFRSAMDIMSEELKNDHDREPDRSRLINFVVENRKGDTFFYESTASFLRDNEGNATHSIAVTRDITERVKLQEKLEESLTNLRERNEIIENDMKTAQLIQQALLPEGSPSNSYMTSSYRYLPVEVVGGDYFNFIELREGGVGVFIADVVGHGVPAALFLSLLKSSTNKIWRRHALEPQEFMNALNDDLVDVMSSYFITGLYGFLTKNSDNSVSFTFSNGGHPPPLVYRAAKGIYEPIHLKGPLVGAFREKEYHETTIILNKKDRLFIYTDGLPETVNSDRQIIGFDHLTTFFMEGHADSLDSTLDNIVSMVEKFRDDTIIQDDMVLIGIEIL